MGFLRDFRFDPEEQPPRDPQREGTVTSRPRGNGRGIAQHHQLDRNGTVQPDRQAGADPLYRAG